MKNRPSSAKKDATPKKEQLFVSLIAGVLVLACVVVGGLSLYNAGYFTSGTSNSARAAAAAAECEQIVEQAMDASDSFCDQIGPNSVCYGNITLQAELIPGADEPFSQRGDVIGVESLRRLSAAPLDLNNNEWGIAVFKVMANLPNSLPGENVTMVVFGNTTIDTPNQNLETFYFTSTLGQMVCEQVPFDGIMIDVPDGSAVQFVVNGTSVTLRGSAALRAEVNGQMDIDIFRGSALVAANGVEQVVGAGQGVSLELGGENGNEAVGPPSDPFAISQGDIAIACTMTGQFCSDEVIPTMSIETAMANLTPDLVDTPTRTPNPTGNPAATATRTATPTVTPTRIPPTATNPPPPTATNPPPPTATNPPPPTTEPIPMITICHWATNKFVPIVLVDDGVYGGHGTHTEDLIPAPAEGCP